MMFWEKNHFEKGLLFFFKKKTYLWKQTTSEKKKTYPWEQTTSEKKTYSPSKKKHIWDSDIKTLESLSNYFCHPTMIVKELRLFLQFQS